MKITQIESILFEPDWDDPFAAQHRRVHAALKVHTDEGLTGVSRTGGAQVRLIEDYFAPVLLGQDPRDVERLWSQMYQTAVAHRLQATGVIGALDIALWDLLGKSASLPCWQLLGGYRDWVPVYADVPTRAETPEQLGEQLAAGVNRGFDAVKFHILQTDPDHIVAETRAARAAVGPNVKLMIDLFALIDVRTAIEICRRIEPYDLFWVEEPVLRHDQPLGLALVSQNTRIPIAGGEGEHTIYGVRALLERGGLTYLQADVVGAGGFTAWRKIAGLAEAYHVWLAPHGASLPDLHAHLVAAFPHGVIIPATTPDQPPEIWAHLWQDVHLTRGQLHLSRRPGLGLEFDEGFLRRYGVSRT